MPVISIIMPIYNGEKYLREALDSVRNQRYRNWECLCINDGGTDASVAIVTEFAKADNRFVLIDKANEGVATTRNYGINHSKGEFITFLDQDDILHTRFLELSVSAAESTGADVVSIGINTVYDNRFDTEEEVVQSEIRTDNHVIDSWIEALSSKGFANINAWGKLYKRDALAPVRFPEGVFGADDFVFTMRIMLKRGRWAFCEDTKLYIYRMNPENITSRMPAKYIYGFLEAARIIGQELQGCKDLTGKQMKAYFKAESKRILSWAIKKTVRNSYAPVEVVKIQELLVETRKSGVLRFYSLRDWLKYVLFVRGNMRMLTVFFPRLAKPR